jgi:fatty-acyl-CoA synthase
MQIGMLLEMAASGAPHRRAIGSGRTGMTFSELRECAARAGSFLRARSCARVSLIDLNSPAVPLALFGAASAGAVYAPINYRLPDDRLVRLVERIAPAVVIIGEGIAERIGPPPPGIVLVPRSEFLEACWSGDPGAPPAEPRPEDTAALIFTSGTSGDPKAAVLRHQNLTSYVISTVDFMSASENDCALVSVPAYHIAGISAVLSCTYSGRRMVQLAQFDAKEWVALARQESVTHAMIVPTMLELILDILEEAPGPYLPALQTLSYGGGPMPLPVIERAMRVLPHVGFVNAYGLTETSSTIAVLTPEDHRTARDSQDDVVRARLESVGRSLPSVDVSIRDEQGNPVPTGQRGEIWVRGGQVGGEYAGQLSAMRSGDWFPTRDEGHLDAARFLFVHGRLDDVIVRGGENLSPGEIEAVLRSHPAVRDAAVVGLPDTRWGETVAAVIVLDETATASSEELQEHVRTRLRSTMTPALIRFREALPYSDTGKLLRRVVRADLVRPEVNAGDSDPRATLVQLSE